MALEAVVMAAGEGSRLRPLTGRWAKPVLPIDGRPVLGTLLRELSSAGIARATVVVGHLAAQVRELAGDGSAFGLEIVYADQPEPLGSADAVRRALAAGASPPLLVSAADTVYRPGTTGAAAHRWLESGAPGGICVRTVPADEVGRRSAVAVAEGRVVALADGGSPTADGPGLAAAPLWFLGPRLIARLDGLPGPPYELAAAFRAAIEAGEEIAALEIGPTRDITRPEDVVAQNFPYLERSERA